MRWKCSIVAATISATSAAFAASAASANARPPSFSMIRAVSRAAASSRSAQTTLAPSRAKRTAVAFPLPQPGPIEPAPTTRATLSERRPAIATSLAMFPPRSSLPDAGAAILIARPKDEPFQKPAAPGMPARSKPARCSGRISSAAALAPIS